MYKRLVKLVELLESKGVQLVSIKENIDASTATGRLMLKMISAINDFERENMLERQREGIAIALKQQESTKDEKKYRFQTSTSHIKDISFENYRSLSLQRK
ncbi:recombinase family protein [Peribacillus simplex]|uniref:recombinase family protein n=1 Tax=Peribacillus simplex TaxID=1478 RepID=UPI0024C18C91|nr:recombinase family protein [Peribacillus simplex]WHX93725.1 recombinase family protein [Peribacillus simplex]